MIQRFPARARAAVAICAAAALCAWGTAAIAAGPEGALDQRSWELVSPVAKNGGGIEAPGEPGAAVVQAAAGGGALAFGSAASFGTAVGAAPASQYVARRAATGWTTENLTPPLLSGTYPGGAYQLFSPGLERAILGSGWSCRDGGAVCPAENPPLGGAPAGYRNLYLREGAQYEPLVTVTNAPGLAAIDPEAFRLELAGAAPDLGHAVISSCAALTGPATEVPLGDGCDPAATNLYLWSSDGSLEAINLLPGEEETAPGAGLGATAGAISADGSRVYWRGGDGNLYLREAGATIQVDAGAGGGGQFQVASENGSVAYFLSGGHLFRFTRAGLLTTDLGASEGALGISVDGSRVYHLSAAGLFLVDGPAPAVEVADDADPSNLPAATGTARVSADGSRLTFISSASLTGYPNQGKTEVYLYEAPADRLRCVSCNPRGVPPLGPSSIPGALAAGDGPTVHKPRALSADGTRVFFDSADALVAQDSNGAPDVYEWEANGSGSCAKALGCLGLISGGRSGSASFLDASADGNDAFFRTDVSLLPSDTAAFDVYNARPGSGFPEPEPGIPCEGDACQGPAPAPPESAPATAVLVGPPNPPVRFKEPKKQKNQNKKKNKKKKNSKHGQKGKQGKKGGRR